MTTRRIIAVAAGALLLGATAARADDASTLTVVGTSDVFDSDLVQSVLAPGFQTAYPRYRLHYVSLGSGAAIDYAEAGTASALLVHAAPLESRFVAAGYSRERYGRAIFWGDYVILGPPDDPAHVRTGAPHDAAAAFARIAAAGAAGRANFVSRGGTPGTTVAEHAIWALAKGVTTCSVAAADGGGAAPGRATGSCPRSGGAPAWYHATGLTQAPNIENAAACNYPGGHCYLLTDRGTYRYLASTGAIGGALRIVARDNAAAAPGGRALLVNSFHAYAVNPARFRGRSGVQLNLPAATAFLRWITSPRAQAAIGAFLGGDGDPPFHPDAAPAIATARLPDRSTTMTLTGRLSNVVRGTPPLSGVPVTLLAGASGRPVGHTLTRAGGSFAFRRRRFLAGVRYIVSTGAIAQIENRSITPPFGDLLHPASAVVPRAGQPPAPRAAPARGTSRSPGVAGHSSSDPVPWIAGGGLAALVLALSVADTGRRRQR